MVYGSRQVKDRLSWNEIAAPATDPDPQSATDAEFAEVHPVDLVMDLPTCQRAERLLALALEVTDLVQPRLREIGERVAASVTAMSPAERAGLRPAAFSPPLTTTDPAARRAKLKRPRRAVSDGS